MGGKAEEKQYAEKESDTVHVHIESQESLRSDLEYLAEKMGISIEQLRQERYLKEKAEKEAEQNRRWEKHQKAEAAREAALEKEFLDNYGFREGHYGLTLNGKRLQKLKDFNEITCGQCGVFVNIKGYAQDIVEWGRRTYDITGNPLSDRHGVPARVSEVKCANGHKNELIVQYIL